MTNPIDLQGLYLFSGRVIYLAWEPVNEVYMYKSLTIGTSIDGYSSMANLYIPFSNFFLLITPLVLGWLSTSAIPSDLYPELFI